MPETPFTLDPTRLRAMAERVERAAGTVDRARYTGLCSDDLPGSATAGVAAPVLVAERLADALTELLQWAASTRKSVDAFAIVDRDHADRLDRW
jgi:hypothetical protein